MVIKNVAPQMPNGGVFDVKAYRAVGNGTTDDATAINNCLSAAGTYAASNGGAMVVFPPARYKWGSLKEVPSDVTIYAYGAFILGDSTDGFIKNYGSTPAAGYTTGNQRITILGGTWDGKGQSAATNTNYSLFYFRNARGITIRDATFRNGAGLPAVHLLAIDGATVQNCRFEGYVDNTTGGSGYSGQGEAVQLDQDGSGNTAKNVSMMQCYVGAAIDGSALGSFRTGFGSHFDTASHWYTGIRVIGNHFDSCVDRGLFVIGWQDSVISDNTIVSTGVDGIRLASNNNSVSERIAITGNVIQNAGARCIYVDPGSNLFRNLTINNNITDTSGSVYSCIDIRKVNASAVAGNHLNSSGSDGIAVVNCNDVLIGDNNVQTAGNIAINLVTSSQCQIVSNRIYDCGRDGVYLQSGSGRNAVVGNVVIGASRTTNNTYYPLRVGGNASDDDNVFIGNRVSRDGSTANNASVAFRKESGTGATGNTVVFNSFEGWSTTHSSNVSVVNGTVDYNCAAAASANNCQA